MTLRFDFDAVCALSKGARNYQEDAVISDFSRGADVGLAVLADGMGGHAAGDVASKIVVTEVFSELMFQSCDPQAFETNIASSLHDAAMAANACLREHVRAFPETRGMGATLVATAIINRNLYWISIGDSPLYLYRDGTLQQLNEDHSLAPQIDLMVQSGLLDAEEAKHHPDRNTLTSVLFGEQFPQIDCPAAPLELMAGDIVIVASDGLQFLSEDQISAVLGGDPQIRSAELADRLMEKVCALDDPDLDNVSFSLVRLEGAGTAAQSVPAETRAQQQSMRCVG